jgi:hypothetical protein
LSTRCCCSVAKAGIGDPTMTANAIIQDNRRGIHVPPSVQTGAAELVPPPALMSIEQPSWSHALGGEGANRIVVIELPMKPILSDVSFSVLAAVGRVDVPDRRYP